jgi:hypothetical protein
LQRTYSYEQYTVNGYQYLPVLTDKAPIQTVGTFSQSPTKAVPAGGTLISISAGVKVDVSFNFMKFLESISN